MRKGWRRGTTMGTRTNNASSSFVYIRQRKDKEHLLDMVQTLKNEREYKSEGVLHIDEIFSKIFK